MSDNGDVVEELPQLWQYIHPLFKKGSSDNDEEEDEENSIISNKETAIQGANRPEDYTKLSKKAPRLGQLIRYLNDIEDDEELQNILLEKDPVTQQTLLQWATLNRHFMLVEYIVKRLQRSAFSFDPEFVDVAVYNRWEEMRPELPTAAQVAERQQQREQERAKRLAERQEEDEEEEDEEEENEPTPEELVFEALDDYQDQLGENGVGVVKRIGELGVYIGARLRDGTKQGLGQSLYPNGDCYAGEYSEDQRDGLGTYMWSDFIGMMYTGQWSKNKRHGYGRMVYPDGSRYLGYWSANVKSGKGRYTYADGSAYDGEWVANLKHGYGVYSFTDGSAYVGTFQDNEFVSGEWHLANGTIRYMGNFERGQPVGSGVFMHRCGMKEGAYLEEGTYHNGKWQPNTLKGTTKFVPRLEVLAMHMKTTRVPISFGPSCNGHTTADLVRAANFVPLQRWISALPSSLTDPKDGVELKSIEICSLGYGSEHSDQLVDLLIRPLIVDAAGAKLHGASDEILLKQPATRLLTLLENPSGKEPLVVLEHSLQYAASDEGHQQYRLPTVEVTANGAMGGAFARAVGAALALRFEQSDHVVNLVSPLRSNPFYTNAEERVLLYRQQLHRDAFATLEEKLKEASRCPVVVTYTAVPLSRVAEVSSEAITVIAASTAIQRRKVQNLPDSTAPAQRPPTPLAPAPQPRPDIQPLYVAKSARDEEGED